jgi:regulator of replication initiation timing
METNNEELLKSTKLMITNLKRENQKLIEENHLLQTKVKERDGRDSKEAKDSSVKDKEQSLINSIKKARKMIDSHNSITHREESATANWQDKSEEFLKGRRSSLSSIRPHK